VGSYADGSAVPLSDVDIRVVFKGDFQDRAEEERFRDVRQYCRLLSPVGIDLPPLSEARLMKDEDWVHETISIRDAGRLLWGDDIRSQLPEVGLDAYTRNVTGAPIVFLAPWYGSTKSLRFPLTYPEPDAPFYGYVRPDRGTPCTKLFVHVIGLMASCLLALRAGRIVSKKSDWLPRYRAHIGDAWTPLLEAIYGRCKQEWRYGVPEEEADRRALHDLCGRSLAFQNHYLAHYRNYLRTHLRSEQQEDRLFATRRLESICYPELRATRGDLPSA
jgi:hypothetical protein